MDSIKSVLFVCTGNSCRSVMAEGLLKKRLKETGKDHIEVWSAGVAAFGGLPPTEETIEVMKESGADISGHRTRALTADMIRRADLILVMEPSHKEAVVRAVPAAARKTYLLKEFGIKDPAVLLGDELGIRDPIGMPIGEYRHSLDVIKREIDRIAQVL